MIKQPLFLRYSPEFSPSEIDPLIDDESDSDVSEDLLESNAASDETLIVEPDESDDDCRLRLIAAINIGENLKI